MTDNNLSLAGQPGKQADSPHCLLADASIFIGMTSLPVGDELGFFREMNEFFATYRSGVVSLLTNADKWEGSFYQPTPYLLLGSFDVAFLALIDDFEFPVQTFHPLHPDFPGANDKPQRNFAHRTLIGPCPRWAPNDPGGKLIELAKRTFLRDEPSPLVGLCQVEVNTCFHIGGGGNFIRCLLKAINSLFRLMFKEKEEGPDEQTELVILEGFSWHELTLLVFSDSFKKISDFIMQVRSLTLLDMGLLLYRTQKGKREAAGKNYYDVDDPRTTTLCQQEWDTFVGLGQVYELAPVNARITAADEAVRRQYQTLGQEKLDALVRCRCSAPEEYYKQTGTMLKPPYGTHVLYNTATTLGFSAHLLRQPLEKMYATGDNQPNLEAALTALCSQDSPLNQVATKDEVCAIRRWMTKAGHDMVAIDALRGSTVRNACDFAPTPGRFDFIYPCEYDPGSENQPGTLKFKTTSSRQLIEEMVVQRLRVNQWRSTQGKVANEPNPGMLSVYTTVALPPENPMEQALPAGHCNADEVRAHFAYTKREVAEILQHLKALSASKVLTGRVLNALALFNEGIRDNFLFSSFLELRPYTERIVKLIRSQAEKGDENPADISDELNKLVDNFEIGWRNRFFGGWRLGEVTDFNLEFKGGIQQLASAFHGAYRMLSWYFTRDLSALAVVAGWPSISVLAGAVRLNFLDIFKPEFFCARAGHEASEQLLRLTDAEWAILRCRLLDESKKEATAWRDCLTRLSLDAFSGDAKQRKKKELQDWARSFSTKLRVPIDNNDARLLALWREGLQAALEPEGEDSASFFDQLYADMCNYRTVFLADHGLYAFGSAASFVVDPVHWGKSGVVDEAAVWEALLRCSLAMLAWVHPDDRAGRDDVRRALKAYWHELASESRVGAVFSLAESLIRLAQEHSKARKQAMVPGKYVYGQLADVGDWIEAARFFAKNSLPTKLLAAELSSFGRELKSDGMKETYEKHFLRSKDEPRSSRLRSYVTHSEGGTMSRVDEAYACLKSGRAYVGGQARHLLRNIERNSYPFEADRWFDFCDTIALMYAYLKLIKNESGIDDPGKQNRMILQRDKEGKVLPKPKDGGKYARLVFDSRGGSFTFDPEFRRKYFMWRSALVMSVYDIAEKAKLVYCDQFLRLNESSRGKSGPSGQAEPCV